MGGVKTIGMNEETVMGKQLQSLTLKERFKGRLKNGECLVVELDETFIAIVEELPEGEFWAESDKVKLITLDSTQRFEVPVAKLRVPTDKDVQTLMNVTPNHEDLEILYGAGKKIEPQEPSLMQSLTSTMGEVAKAVTGVYAQRAENGTLLSIRRRLANKRYR